MKLYSLYDKKGGFYGSVMMAATDGLMTRTLSERVDPRDTLARFPEDFDLYDVGEFDDQTGKVSRDGEVRFVCNMAVVFKKEG